MLTRTREGRAKAIAFLEQIEQTRSPDHNTAVAILRSHEDKTYSLCDALSFVVMERLGITEAITFDRHFRQYGRFKIL